MQFLKCDPAHQGKLTAFYHQVVRYLEENVNYPHWNADHPSDESIAQAIDSGLQYICLDNGEIVGAVVLSEDPEGLYDIGKWSRELKLGEFLIVHVLAVSPDHLHKGVGDFMVKECIELAKNKGYRAVRLDVVPGNTPAVRLYEKNGFTYAGSGDLQRYLVDIPVFDLYELNL